MNEQLHNQEIEEQYYKEHPESPLNRKGMENLIKIQSELKAPKNQYNNFGKYKYRKCEDVLEALKPLLKKYGCTLTISDEIKEVSGIPFVEATAIFIDKDGSQTIVTAQAGIDPDRKGMDISQSFGSSSSYARKYALNGLFLIDDNEDADSHPQPEQKKPSLKPNTEAWDKVVKALDNGYTIEQVKEKYTISKANEKKLIG